MGSNPTMPTKLELNVFRLTYLLFEGIESFQGSLTASTLDEACESFIEFTKHNSVEFMHIEIVQAVHASEFPESFTEFLKTHDSGVKCY